MHGMGRWHICNGPVEIQSTSPTQLHGVLVHTLLDLCALPLADAGSTGIGQHSAAHLLKEVQEAITLNGGPTQQSGQDWQIGRDQLTSQGGLVSLWLECCAGACAANVCMHEYVKAGHQA